MENTKQKLPFGFFVCALSFTFERCAYYTAKWGLAVFIVVAAANGGLGLSDTVGANMNGNLVAFTYITPIIGGYIADRYVSPRLLVPIGEVLMGIGYIAASQAHSLGMLWIMIITVAIGTGLFKGNVSGVNGRLFDNDEARLNEVFNYQYMFVNIGSFCGTTFLCLIPGAVGGTNGYRIMFFVCAIFLFIDCAWWLLGSKSFGEAGKKPFLVDNRAGDGEEAKVEKTPLTKLEKNRVIAICVVTVFSGIFWLIWYMVYMPVYYKFGPIDQGGLGWANWNIGSFTMPTAWFDSANGLLCIILCPVFAKIWVALAKRPQGDFGMFTKTAVGIIILGLCVVCMVIAAIMSGESSETPVGIWIIFLTALCMTVGEVIFSPLGNAFISKYAPKQLLGTLLGVWPLIIFFSGKLYGPLYGWLNNFDFVKAYGLVAAAIIAVGVLMLLFTKKFDAMISGENL